MDICISIVVTFVLVLVNGYFLDVGDGVGQRASTYCCRSDADEGRRARRSGALGLAQDSGLFLATSRWPSRHPGSLPHAAAATNLSDPLAQWLSGFGIDWPSAARPDFAPVVHHAHGVVSEHRGGRAGAEAHRWRSRTGSKMVAGPSACSRRFTLLPLVSFDVGVGQRSGSAYWASRTATRTRRVPEEEIKLMVADNDELLEDERRMIHEIIDLRAT